MSCFLIVLIVLLVIFVANTAICRNFFNVAVTLTPCYLLCVAFFISLIDTFYILVFISTTLRFYYSSFISHKHLTQCEITQQNRSFGIF